LGTSIVMGLLSAKLSVRFLILIFDAFWKLDITKEKANQGEGQ